MTNLTPEQIREAVELADGLMLRDASAWYELRQNYGDKPFIAALASQLISQVDAMPDGIRFQSHRGYAAIRKYDFSDAAPMKVKPNDLATKYGPHRDDNSILACTEFLRGMK